MSALKKIQQLQLALRKQIAGNNAGRPVSADAEAPAAAAAASARIDLVRKPSANVSKALELIDTWFKLESPTDLSDAYHQLCTLLSTMAPKEVFERIVVLGPSVKEAEQKPQKGGCNPIIHTSVRPDAHEENAVGPIRYHSRQSKTYDGYAYKLCYVCTHKGHIPELVMTPCSNPESIICAEMEELDSIALSLIDLAWHLTVGNPIHLAIESYLYMILVLMREFTSLRDVFNELSQPVSDSHVKSPYTQRLYENEVLHFLTIPNKYEKAILAHLLDGQPASEVLDGLRQALSAAECQKAKEAAANADLHRQLIDTKRSYEEQLLQAHKVIGVQDAALQEQGAALQVKDGQLAELLRLDQAAPWNYYPAASAGVSFVVGASMQNAPCLLCGEFSSGFHICSMKADIDAIWTCRLGQCKPVFVMKSGKRCCECSLQSNQLCDTIGCWAPANIEHICFNVSQAYGGFGQF